jgi:hypothetical protein
VTLSRSNFANGQQNFPHNLRVQDFAAMKRDYNALMIAKVNSMAAFGSG